MLVLTELFSYIDALVGWLRGLPDTLVGIVIGSLFTLTGVVLTNRSNLKNLRLQLAHDRGEKARERSLSLRRDVYLGAAEAISAALNTVVRYPDLSLDHAQLMADYRDRSSQIAKIHVIASESTALQLMAFMSELGKVYLRLNIERAGLIKIRSQMQSLMEQMHRHNAGRDQNLELMKRFNIEGVMDQRRMEILKSAFNFEQQQATIAAEEHDRLLEALRPKHLAFVELCQTEERRLAAMLLPVIAGVREELEHPIDVDVYAKVFDGAPVVTREDLEMLFGVRPHGQQVARDNREQTTVS